MNGISALLKTELVFTVVSPMGGYRKRSAICTPGASSEPDRVVIVISDFQPPEPSEVDFGVNMLPSLSCFVIAP